MQKKIFLSLLFVFMAANAFAQDGVNEAFVTKYIDGITSIGQIIGYAILAFRGVAIGAKFMNLGSDERSGDEGKKIILQIAFIIGGGVILFGLKAVILFIYNLLQ